MSDAPETILQFGAGRFLRAFVDRFVQHANDAGQVVGRVVIVQSTSGSRAESLAQQGEYHVLVRGYEDGKLIERVDRVASVSRALVAAGNWDAVLELARSPALKFIVSNATESGYILDHADRLDLSPPRTLAGKLAQALWHRFQARGAPLALLPCELIERNADKLRELVRQQSQTWRLPADFQRWASDECLWISNLVDCIVTRGPDDHPLLRDDPLLICAEPYALWAIEKPANREVNLFSHPAIHWVDELSPYYLRKVRILNGCHTAMAGKFLAAGFATVQDVLADRDAMTWVRGLIYEEIVPTICAQVEGVARFADETFDRLRNPFLHHRLADIANNHADKVRVRLQPTFDEYQRLYEKAPLRLSEAMRPLAT